MINKISKSMMACAAGALLLSAPVVASGVIAVHAEDKIIENVLDAPQKLNIYIDGELRKELDFADLPFDIFEKDAEKELEMLKEEGYVQVDRIINKDGYNFYFESPSEEVNDYVLNIFHYSELVEAREFNQVTLEAFDEAVAAVIEEAAASGWVEETLLKEGNQYYLYLVDEMPEETEETSEEAPEELPYYVLNIYKDGELTQTSEYGEIDYDTFWEGAQATINTFVDEDNLEYVHLDVEAQEDSNHVVYSAYLESKDEENEETEEPSYYILRIYQKGQLTQTSEYGEMEYHVFWDGARTTIDSLAEATGLEFVNLDVEDVEGTNQVIYSAYLDDVEDPEVTEEPRYYILRIYQKGQLTQTSEYGEMEYHVFWDGARATIDSLVEATGLKFVNLDVEDVEGTNQVIYSAYLDVAEGTEETTTPDPLLIGYETAEEAIRVAEQLLKEMPWNNGYAIQQGVDNLFYIRLTTDGTKTVNGRPIAGNPETTTKEKEETTQEKPKLPETGESNIYGIFGVAALAILAGVGLVAPSLKKED